jgi:hypothetical protein
MEPFFYCEFGVETFFENFIGLVMGGCAEFLDSGC